MGRSASKPAHRMSNNCRQLVTALKLYAESHDGSYPPSLYDLAPDPLSELELDRLLTEGAAGSESGVAWILTPKLTDSSAATDILILAASASQDRKRIAGLNDGSVISISEDRAIEHLLLRSLR